MPLTKPNGQPTSSGTSGAIKRPADGSNITKRFSAAETRAKLNELKLGIMDGLTDVEIQESLGVTVGTYNELKRELYRQEQAELTKKTTEDVYLEYQWAQQKVIKDIDKMILDIQANESKNSNAALGAFRAKSEIIDKILKVGQDMGIINKEPERKITIHGHAVVNMSNAELRKAITTETAGLAQALAKYGDKDMSGNLLDVGKPELITPAQMNIQGKHGKSMAGPAKAAAARASRQAVKRTKIIDVG